MVSRLFSWAVLPTGLCLLGFSFAAGDSSNLPPGYVIAKNTISPSHRFAFTAPEQDVFVYGNADKEHNQLIDQSSGKVIASIVGEPGCIEEWKGGILNPWWSKDESIVAWSTVNRSFEGAFVVLKMKDGKLLWQLDVMKTCTEEIQNRLQIRKNPVSFKLNDVTVEVDTDPNYFSGQTTAPLTLPLKLRIKAFPPSNALFNATLDATIQDDGTIKMGDFHTFQN